MKRFKKKKRKKPDFSAWHILVCEMPIDCLAYLNNENGSLKKENRCVVVVLHISHARLVDAVYYIKLGRGG